MRLPDFIEANVTPILQAWVDFARQCRPGADGMDRTALRDHATEMLRSFVADLRRPQTASEQANKSIGAGAREGSDSPAAEHGAMRETQGFTVDEMVAEFRALRATVLRLYHAANLGLSAVDQEDLIRFNEAVDQALAESVSRFTQNVDEARDTLIAVLSHDLRTPLTTVQMVTHHVMTLPELDERAQVLMRRADRSVKRMVSMIDALVDFTHGRLGAGLTITRGDMDLGAVLQHAVDEIDTAASPRAITVHIAGALRGNWDKTRMGQVLTNLLGNAVQHGDIMRPITASATGKDSVVLLEVHNYGPAIPASELADLFSPFKRLKHGAISPTGHNLGLGLYIADRVVAAHGGRIDVTSSTEDGTRFVVTVPR